MPTNYKLDELSRNQAQLLLLGCIELRGKMQAGNKNEQDLNLLMIRLQTLLAHR